MWYAASLSRCSRPRRSPPAPPTVAGPACSRRATAAAALVLLCLVRASASSSPRRRLHPRRRRHRAHRRSSCSRSANLRATATVEESHRSAVKLHRGGSSRSRCALLIAASCEDERRLPGVVTAKRRLLVRCWCHQLLCATPRGTSPPRAGAMKIAAACRSRRETAVACEGVASDPLGRPSS